MNCRDCNHVIKVKPNRRGGIIPQRYCSSICCNRAKAKRYYYRHKDKFKEWNYKRRQRYPTYSSEYMKQWRQRRTEKIGWINSYLITLKA